MKRYILKIIGYVRLCRSCKTNSNNSVQKIIENLANIKVICVVCSISGRTYYSEGYIRSQEVTPDAHDSSTALKGPLEAPSYILGQETHHHPPYFQNHVNMTSVQIRTQQRQDPYSRTDIPGQRSCRMFQHFDLDLVKSINIRVVSWSFFTRINQLSSLHGTQDGDPALKIVQ